MDIVKCVDKITTLADYNPAAFNFSEEEARARKLWRDSRPMPTQEELESAWIEVQSDIEREAINNEALLYLDETDWKVIRHRDQLALGIQTSLTDEEYNAILAERQSKRDLIVR